MTDERRWTIEACPTCGDDLTDCDRTGHMWDEHGGIDGGTA